MTSVELRNRIGELRADKRNFPSFFGLAATAGLVALGILILRTQSWWWAAPVVFVLNGFMQYRCINAAHESVHKNLFHPVWLNEVMGTICSAMAGVSMLSYRQGHLEHHKSPQSIEDDSDGYIYRPLLQCPPGWPRVKLLIGGLFSDIAMKLKRKFFGHERESAKVRVGKEQSALRGVLIQFVPLTLVQGAMWAIFWWQINFWSYFVFWFAPIFFVALFLDRTRTFIEHTYQYFFPGPINPNLAEAPQTTIDVGTTWFEKFFFAPFGFAYHQAHHAQLTVPFYHLGRLADLLEEHQPGYYRRVNASYFTLLKRVLWAGSVDLKPASVD